MKIAFLSFPDQSELLLSELKNRFGINTLPTSRYGDLLYLLFRSHRHRVRLGHPPEKVGELWNS